jgi:hypothetical protein
MEALVESKMNTWFSPGDMDQGGQVLVDWSKPGPVAVVSVIAVTVLGSRIKLGSIKTVFGASLGF